MVDHQADSKSKIGLLGDFNKQELEPLQRAFIDLPKDKLKLRARALGVESIEQLKDVQPDPERPLRMFYVRLDNLRTYRKGTDPWPLLQRTNTFVYPLVVPKKDNKIISGVLVQVDTNEQDQKNNYRFSQLGASLSVPFRVLSKAKQELLAKDTNCDYFLITIPALNKRLLGIRHENSCNFRVIDLSEGKDNPLNDLSLQSAQDVFYIIAQEVKTAKYEMPFEDENYPIPEQ
ncbi:MAG: hypothetical protein MRJ68_09190 [Nitrospira sp.]|nr:hypothetical protein [Nitrospira sp.]